MSLRHAEYHVICCVKAGSKRRERERERERDDQGHSRLQQSGKAAADQVLCPLRKSARNEGVLF